MNPLGGVLEYDLQQSWRQLVYFARGALVVDQMGGVGHATAYSVQGKGHRNDGTSNFAPFSGRVIFREFAPGERSRGPRRSGGRVS